MYLLKVNEFENPQEIESQQKTNISKRKMITGHRK